LKSPQENERNNLDCKIQMQVDRKES